MELAVEQKHLGPWSFLLSVMGVELFATFAVDMYIPALPSMTRELGVSIEYLNLTLFLFFLAAAVATVFAGAVSDRIGRRKLLLIGSVSFIIGSLVCAVAPNVEVLIVGRLGESFGFGSFVTLTTAIISESYTGSSLTLAMSSLQSLIIVGPALAPFLGTALISVFGWRSVFVALTGCGLVCLVLSALVTETHEPEGGGLKGLIQATFGGFGHFRKDRPFLSMVAILGLMGLPYFAFLAVVSYILLDGFGLSYLEYSVLYVIMCLASIVAPYVYMALSKRFGVSPILLFSFVLTALSVVALFMVASLSAWLFILVLLPYFVAEGVVRPMAFMVLLNQEPEWVGSASALANFSYGVLTSIGTVAGTLSVWQGDFIFAIAVLTALSLVLMLVCYLWGGWSLSKR